MQNSLQYKEKIIQTLQQKENLHESIEMTSKFNCIIQSSIAKQLNESGPLSSIPLFYETDLYKKELSFLYEKYNTEQAKSFIRLIAEMDISNFLISKNANIDIGYTNNPNRTNPTLKEEAFINVGNAYLKNSIDIASSTEQVGSLFTEIFGEEKKNQICN